MSIEQSQIRINRACNGDHTVELSAFEMTESWKRLRAERLSVHDIAQRLNVPQVEVMKWGVAGRALEGRRAGVAVGAAQAAAGVEPAVPVARAVVSDPFTIDELLRRAEQTDVPTLTKLATKVREAASKLRVGVKEHEAKAEARAEVERLERQLALAKARLKSGPAVPEPKTATTVDDSEDVDLGAVREWAWANGYDVAPKGRVSAKVIEAYRQAQAS